LKFFHYSSFKRSKKFSPSKISFSLCSNELLNKEF
jgi:hypothetical protein